MTDVKKQHQDSLDILRGIAVFMVVWGHLIDNENILYRYLNNLHLPVFYAVSGYLLANSFARHSSEFVFRQKIYRLLIPFLSWSTVSFIMKNIIAIKDNYLSMQTVANNFSDVFLYANSAWFLWVLFVASSLIIIYEKIDKKIFWTLILCVYIFLPNDIFKIGKLKIMFPIFFFCFWLKKKDKIVDKNNLHKSIWGGVLALSNFFLIALYFIYDKEIFISFSKFGIPIISKNALWYLYYWVIQFSGICFSICLYLLLRKYFLAKPLKIIGTYSLDIYMQHLFFVNYIIKTTTNATFSDQILIILYAVFITALCMFMSKYILHKVKLYRIFMIGKEYIHVNEQ